MNNATSISGPDDRASLASLGAPRSPGLADTQRAFGNVLARATADPDANPEQEARDAAERFVAQAMITPLLKQLREHSWAAPPFAPSNAEKQFTELQDAYLADSIAGASNFPLVDHITRDLLAAAGQEETR